jgi:molecular chaperone HtpG
MVAQAQVLQFQAETKQLLDLMIHSLYTSKDIFLRELISNASDALDRLRFEALTRPELMDGDDKLEIRLDVNKEEKTLTISDNGIGMNREEVVANIGTIAKSGTRELRERMAEGASKEQLAEMIGQFGVGFYSAFMVADKVVIVTRRAGEEPAIRWESTGDGQYSLTATEETKRGTSITLHLKPADTETGIEDFTDKWILARIVKRYSDFVSYPIVFTDRREGGDVSVEGEKAAPESEKATIVEDKVLNTMKPIWTRPPAEVTTEESTDFYKHVFHSMEDPLDIIQVRAEGLLEYQALLFIPQKAPRDLYYHGAEVGLRLYAKGVLIMERCESLIPHYLRFIKGVVDSADLPLNISRQMLQQDRHITQVRKWITKKVLEELARLYNSDNEKYLSFWTQFGRALKEGVSSDWENKDKVVSLLLFESSHDPEKLTTLQDYVSRMKEDQEEIFYLTGESRKVVENSPHLEAFKDRGYEVLYLTDPVDELVVQALGEFEKHKLKSVGKGTMKLGNEEENERVARELKEKEEAATGLLTSLQKKLDAYVKQVRLTNRLTASPVCLVAGAEYDESPFMERLLQRGKGGGTKQRRIMELNPNHELFLKMQERYQASQDDPLLSDYAELLLGYAFLAEGSELPNPVEFNRLVASLMTRNL